MYITYCENKPKSESFIWTYLHTGGTFFQVSSLLLPSLPLFLFLTPVPTCIYHSLLFSLSFSLPPPLSSPSLLSLLTHLPLSSSSSSPCPLLNYLPLISFSPLPPTGHPEATEAEAGHRFLPDQAGPENQPVPATPQRSPEECHEVWVHLHPSAGRSAAADAGRAQESQRRNDSQHDLWL